MLRVLVSIVIFIAAIVQGLGYAHAFFPGAKLQNCAEINGRTKCFGNCDPFVREFENDTTLPLWRQSCEAQGIGRESFVVPVFFDPALPTTCNAGDPGCDTSGSWQLDGNDIPQNVYNQTFPGESVDLQRTLLEVGESAVGIAIGDSVSLHPASRVIFEVVQEANQACVYAYPQDVTDLRRVDDRFPVNLNEVNDVFPNENGDLIPVGGEIRTHCVDAPPYNVAFTSLNWGPLISDTCTNYFSENVATQFEFSFSTRVVQCIEESINAIFIPTALLPETNQSFYTRLQDRVGDFVRALLALYLIVFGYKMMMNFAVIQRNEWMWLGLKLALVIYFSLGAGLVEIFPILHGITKSGSSIVIDTTSRVESFDPEVIAANRDAEEADRVLEEAEEAYRDLFNNVNIRGRDASAVQADIDDFTQRVSDAEAEVDALRASLDTAYETLSRPITQAQQGLSVLELLALNPPPGASAILARARADINTAQNSYNFYNNQLADVQNAASLANDAVRAFNTASSAGFFDRAGALPANDGVIDDVRPGSPRDALYYLEILSQHGVGWYDDPGVRNRATVALNSYAAASRDPSNIGELFRAYQYLQVAFEDAERIFGLTTLQENTSPERAASWLNTMQYFDGLVDTAAAFVSTPWGQANDGRFPTTQLINQVRANRDNAALDLCRAGGVCVNGLAAIPSQTINGVTIAGTPAVPPGGVLPNSPLTAATEFFDNVSAEVSRLQAELSASERDLQILQDELARLQTELDTLNLDTGTLQAQLDELLQSRNVAFENARDLAALAEQVRADAIASGDGVAGYNYCDFSQAEYPEEYRNLRVFDTIDCKVLKYMGVGDIRDRSGDGPPSSFPIDKSRARSPQFLLFASQAIVSSPLGIPIFLLSLIFIAFVLLLVIRVVQVYIIAYLALVLLLFAGPLVIPAALFETTKNIFNTWVKQVIAFMLQPILVFAFIAVAFMVIDAVYFGSNHIFDEHRQIAVNGDGECPDPDTIACLYQQATLHTPDNFVTDATSWLDGENVSFGALGTLMIGSDASDGTRWEQLDLRQGRDEAIFFALLQLILITYVLYIMSTVVQELSGRLSDAAGQGATKLASVPLLSPTQLAAKEGSAIWKAAKATAYPYKGAKLANKHRQVQQKKKDDKKLDAAKALDKNLKQSKAKLETLKKKQKLNTDKKEKLKQEAKKNETDLQRLHDINDKSKLGVPLTKEEKRDHEVLTKQKQVLEIEVRRAEEEEIRLQREIKNNELTVKSFEADKKKSDKEVKKISQRRKGVEVQTHTNRESKGESSDE